MNPINVHLVSKMFSAQWFGTIEGGVGNSEKYVKSTKPVFLYHMGLHTFLGGSLGGINFFQPPPPLGRRGLI